jgi:prepilin-type N-terminal cleavage/methylation domain-containing protein
VKAAKDLRKTSHRKNNNQRLNSQKGFTLLEVIIVLGILGAMLAFGVPKFRNQSNNIKTVARQLSGLTREVRNQARLKKMTYRIAFRVGEKGAYWVENAPGDFLIPSKTTLENIKSLDEKDRPASPFQKVTKFSKDEKELPSGLSFISVETPSMDEAASKEVAYVYFSPEGLVEKGVIQIGNRKDLTWTLIINPITGHTDIVEKAMALKDLRFE